jgi:hypothetical protein
VAAGGAFGVGAGPVPADHVNAGVIVEPGGQGVGAPAVEHVDDLVGEHVDHKK